MVEAQNSIIDIQLLTNLLIKEREQQIQTEIDIEIRTKWVLFRCIQK